MSDNITPTSTAEASSAVAAFRAPERRLFINMVDAAALADSNDVATYFVNAHRDVLQTTDNLLSQGALAWRNFT